MRYIKVLIAVVFFYFIMLFFVQNQEMLSQTMPLRLDLMFIPPMESAPLSFYALALISFLLGGLAALTMLVWDRLALSAQVAGNKRRIRGLEKELQKSGEELEKIKEELSRANARIEATEKHKLLPISGDSTFYSGDTQE